MKMRSWSNTRTLPVILNADGASYYTASFSSLAGRNAIFLLALILIASPVAGFLPMRAGRARTCRGRPNVHVTTRKVAGAGKEGGSVSIDL
jgi:hypothetical protein